MLEKNWKGIIDQCMWEIGQSWIMIAKIDLCMLSATDGEKSVLLLMDRFLPIFYITFKFSWEENPHLLSLDCCVLFFSFFLKDNRIGSRSRMFGFQSQICRILVFWSPKIVVTEEKGRKKINWVLVTESKKLREIKYKEWKYKIKYKNTRNNFKYILYKISSGSTRVIIVRPIGRR